MTSSGKNGLNISTNAYLLSHSCFSFQNCLFNHIALLYYYRTHLKNKMKNSLDIHQIYKLQKSFFQIWILNAPPPPPPPPPCTEANILWRNFYKCKKFKFKFMGFYHHFCFILFCTSRASLFNSLNYFVKFG